MKNEESVEKSVIEDELTERQWVIIESAIKIFFEKGFEKARTADIAREAGVAEGTIFRYYKTKKDLLLGLVVPLVAKFFRPLMLESVEKIIDKQDEQPVREVLKKIYLDRLDLIEKNFPLIKTVMLESNYHPELLNTIQEKIAPQIVSVVDRLMEGYVKDETFREIDPRRLTRTFISLLMGYIMLTKSFPDLFATDNREEEISVMVDIVLKGAQTK